MTRAELEAHPNPWITAEVAAKVMHGDAHAIRLQARQHPEMLGFPISVCGTRLRIPKQSFIDFWFGKEPE